VCSKFNFPKEGGKDLDCANGFKVAITVQLDMVKFGHNVNEKN